MPLLMCPNCQAGMKEVDRNGIRIDFCPTCRGVWLDRGELELLLNIAGGETVPISSRSSVYPPPPPPTANQPAWGQEHREQDHHDKHNYGHSDHYRAGGHHLGKKRSIKDIFDIFD